jgi:hypothetical protein
MLQFTLNSFAFQGNQTILLLVNQILSSKLRQQQLNIKHNKQK